MNSSAKNLKYKTNKQGKPDYINKQLPDQLAEQNREIRQIIHDQKKKEENLPNRDRIQIEIKDKTVYFDGVAQGKHSKQVFCEKI